jgi:hypothetical protein
MGILLFFNARGRGYWKATGADKPIGQPKTVGIKKALVFYAHNY